MMVQAYYSQHKRKGNNMIEIKAYKCADGKVYENEQAANEHQRELDFAAKFYESIRTTDSEFRNVSAEDMIQWLHENLGHVKVLFNIK